MKALVANRGILNRSVNLLAGKSIGRGAKVEEVSKPTISPKEILVKVHATALNPIDFKYIDFIAPPALQRHCVYTYMNQCEIGITWSIR